VQVGAARSKALAAARHAAIRANIRFTFQAHGHKAPLAAHIFQGKLEEQLKAEVAELLAKAEGHTSHAPACGWKTRQWRSRRPKWSAAASPPLFMKAVSGCIYGNSEAFV